MNHPDLLVLVPTRGRPENARRLFDSIHMSAGRVQFLFCIDNDDPLVKSYSAEYRLPKCFGQRLRLNGTLNKMAAEKSGDFPYVGFMGDDHLPRTKDWDARIIEALESLGKVGLVYGNDLLQGERLPTAVFMTSSIPQTLGYMAPPSLIHMYLDNFWLDLGTRLGRIKYLPDVVIEHIHPGAGKVDWDACYEEVNKSTEPDRVSYDRYLHSEFDRDLQKLREVMGG